jgi:hypothetical protein
LLDSAVIHRACAPLPAAFRPLLLVAGAGGAAGIPLLVGTSSPILAVR